MCMGEAGMKFVAQRLSVTVQLSMAQEAAEALGLSVAAIAADPRAAWSEDRYEAGDRRAMAQDCELVALW